MKPHQSPPPRRVLGLRDTAAKIGRSVAWLYKKHNRRALEAKGFPPPLAIPGLLAWDEVAIDRWLDAQMPPALRPRDADLPDQWAGELDARAARLAANLKGHAA